MLEKYLVGTLETPSASSLARPVSPLGGAPGIPESKTSSDGVALRGKGKPIQCRLVLKEYESPDVLRLRFALPSPEQRLGLPVGMHIGLRAMVDGEKVMRQYTPVSDGDEKGHVELLVKVNHLAKHKRVGVCSRASLRH
jgi:nitrate reductase (NAD(P)H)